MSTQQEYLDKIGNIYQTQEVFVVYTNSDLTEGRGRQYPLVVCERESTASRLAKGAYVQGSDAPFHKATAIRTNSGWLVPGVIIEATAEDIRSDVELNAKREVLEKARAAGLTEEEIKLLRS